MDAQEELAFLRSVAASQLQTIKTLTLGCEKYGLTETTPIVRHLAAQDGEIERLRHDIKRHIAIASELATENEGLRDELARKAEGYTRLAEVHEGAMKMWESDERECAMKAYEMAAELKGLREEVERLRAELTEARKLDCRTCFWHWHISEVCNRAGGATKCGGGVRYVSTTPVRLYEKEGKV